MKNFTIRSINLTFLGAFVCFYLLSALSTFQKTDSLIKKSFQLLCDDITGGLFAESCFIDGIIFSYLIVTISMALILKNLKTKSLTKASIVLFISMLILAIFFTTKSYTLDPAMNFIFSFFEAKYPTEGETGVRLHLVLLVWGIFPTCLLSGFCIFKLFFRKTRN